MKKIWISVVIIVAILIGSIFYTNFLNKVTKTMIDYTQTAYENIDKQPDKVSDNIQSVLTHLENNKIVLCAFIDHRLLDEIEFAAKSALEMNKNNEMNDLKLELVLLSEKINQIKDVEVFDLKNIL